MTCCEAFTSCNGFVLLSLSIIAMGLNLTPMFADYAMDGFLFRHPVSCFEWWLPGVVGGGLLVLPSVTMAFAAKKRGSCNSRCGMLLSAGMCLLGIIGALYCLLVSFFALGTGPLICQGADASLSSCNFTIKDIGSLSQLNFDISWYLNKDGCWNKTQVGTEGGRILGDFDLDLDGYQLVNLHLVTFTGLAGIALLEVLFSLFQILAGTCGCVCGTSKRTQQH
ncbi:transmembrane 4 L6 family member 20-like [Megalops cyprinoides]|uniref:transmembrane 4 L6 family member 20-like n=1 Tax=Megalops cyprinoides TaxID=118141 RepID=UPI001863E350|nr:transmembrane 4 L6 family member 20-like [Megalops cyprinoides]